MADSESHVTDINFNMDVDLQIAQMESTIDQVSFVMDYKGVRAVFLFSVIQLGLFLVLCMQPHMF